MEALAQIAAQLGLDHTFFYLFGLVFVLYAILSVTYLKPYQRLLQQRRASIEGVKAEAHELGAGAEEKMNAYRERLKGANDRARQTLRENEELARKEEHRIVGEASARAKDSLQESQRQIDAERKSATTALSGEVPALASEIVKKVLSQPANR